MSLRKLLMAAILAVAPLSANALFTPETGFYSVPSQPGTGVAVEIQNQFLFAAGYVYDSVGRPTFVTIQGQLTSTGTTWLLDSSLFVSSNGRCIGSAAACPYQNPTTVANGTARVEFLAENIMTLRWGQPGALQDLNMFRFEYFTGDEFQSLLGEWDIIVDRYQSNGRFLFSGDKLQLKTATASLITGCATSLEGSPGCSTITTQVTRTSTGSFGFNYVMGVQESDGTVLRRYNFTSLGLGGAFTHGFKGTVTVCTNVTTSIAACAGTPTRFAAYRSSSRQYAQTGTGME